MTNMKTVEVKAFVPARDFALSKQFYQDLGFVLAWSSDDLVEDVDVWWRHVQAQELNAKY